MNRESELKLIEIASRWETMCDLLEDRKASDFMLSFPEVRKLQDILVQWDCLEEKFQKIENWCEAYPLSVFPEPDLEKAAKILKENGMTLDSISASNMRHVLNGIKNIIED